MPSLEFWASGRGNPDKARAKTIGEVTMRIGIVTDIHDETAILAEALAALQAEGVDRIVSLGDTSDLHGKWQDAAGVARLLQRYGAVGVWGNHDHGLCRDVSDAAKEKFPAETLAYMATMRPRLEIEGCHFAHVEPWLNPELIEDLWCFDGRPEDDDRYPKSFAAIPQRVAFMGHSHRWLAVTESGRFEWDGSTPLHFESGTRYLVVVAPLFDGAFAILDTERWVLDPRQLPIRHSEDHNP
jgi:predicted phosphodiesterase